MSTSASVTTRCGTDHCCILDELSSCKIGHGYDADELCGCNIGEALQVAASASEPGPWNIGR